jgi:hypothetical protein
VKKETVEILKNFAGINQGILFREGNELRTMSVMKNVFGTATIDETFGKEFGIYDLNEFLSTLSLFNNPDFDYGDKSVDIAGDKSKVKYYYSSPTVIVSPPADKKITVKPGLEFKITSDQLDKILKAASVMKLKDLEFTTDGIRAYNKQNGGNQYTLEIDGIKGEISEPKTLLVENIKFLSRDYNVTVGNKAVKFVTEKEDLEYIVAVEDEA